MGTIQNSINQALGTAAGAVALGKHVAEQKKANELAAIREGSELNKESTELIKDAKELQDEYKGTEEGIQANQEEIDIANQYTGPFRDSKGKYTTKDKYITARELAIKELEAQQNAIQVQRADMANRMELYNKRLDALNAIKKGIAPDLNKKLSTEHSNAIEWVKGGNK